MIKEVVETLDLSGKVVISVAAGVTLASLQEWMPRASESIYGHSKVDTDYDQEY